MPETITIPKTEVSTKALIETIGYLEHLADVVLALNGRQSTPLENSLNMAAERLLGASDLRWQDVGPRVGAARARYTRRWTGELMDGVRA